MADLLNLLDEVRENSLPPSVVDEEKDSEEWENTELEYVEPPSEQVLQEEENGVADVEVEGEYEAEHYSRLKLMWEHELACPELLPYQEMIDNFNDELKEKQEEMENLAMEPDKSDVDVLIASIQRVDAERVKFTLTDLLRTRLSKIEQHPLHMREMIDRMSDAEIDHLQGYGQLLERHLSKTVLNQIPWDALKRLDDAEMIDFPNLDQYVVIKVKKQVAINSGTEDYPFIKQFLPGDSLLIRYNSIRDHFAEGEVELLR